MYECSKTPAVCSGLFLKALWSILFEYILKNLSCMCNAEEQTVRLWDLYVFWLV